MTILMMLARSPLVSVLMPSFNNAPFLVESVRSILKQSYKNIELIFVDDGSTDETINILESIQRRDQRIVIIRNDRNKGIVYSLNKGIKRCRGKYVVRMDADDISMPYRIKRQVAYMERHPKISVCGGKLVYIDVKGSDLGIVRASLMPGSILTRNPLLHPTVIIRKEVLEENHFSYQERFRYAEDYFLWLQISRVGRVGSIPDVVLKYRISNQASRVSNLKKMLKATIRVKLAGIFELGIFPSFGDLMVISGELLLLLLPVSWVLKIYLKINFPKGVNINL